MKKVCLIDVEKRPVRVTDHYYFNSFTEPLGLLYLESFLKNKDINVFVFKYPLTENDFDEIKKADIIGISGLTYSWNLMKELAWKIKKLNPHALLIAGREHVSLYSAESLNDSVFDAVVMGEGEKPLLDLAKDKEFNEIPSLVYKNNNGEIIYNKRSTKIEPQDIFPLQRRNFWMKNMFPESQPLHSKMAGLMINRGCLFDCEFCTAKKMWGGLNKLLNDHSINEVESILSSFNINYFAFHDLMINSNMKMLYEFCSEILNRGIIANFFSMMSVTKENIDFNYLRKTGFSEIGVGIEIPSDIRTKIGKYANFKTTVNFLKRISEAGIFIRAYIIIGWPWEKSKEDIIEEYSNAISLLPINNLRINFLVPFPGTITFKKYYKYSIFNPVESGFDHYTGMEPILKFNIESEDLIDIRERILRKFYFSKEYNNLLISQKNKSVISKMNDYFYNYIMNALNNIS